MLKKHNPLFPPFLRGTNLTFRNYKFAVVARISVRIEYKRTEVRATLKSRRRPNLMFRNFNLFGRSQLLLATGRMYAVVHCQSPSGDGSYQYGF